MAVSGRFLTVCLLGVLMLGLGSLAKEFQYSTTASTEDKAFSTSPSFELIDEHGRPFSSDRLSGSTHIVSFFFTSCHGPCPIINANLKRVFDEFRDNPSFKIVSISVDPETDTPKVLRDYKATLLGNTSSHWIFLSGEQDYIRKLATEDFRVALMGTPPVHTKSVVLFSEEGRQLGFFDATDSKEINALRATLRSTLSARNS